MPLHLTWQHILLRLILTFLAGICLGINREEQGRPAGLRTTILVCLAASVSMIQTNLLLDMNGKTPSSFAVMDLMRLPLGILSGMGFIGAGAILRRNDMITGVTTAATLWFATVMGLCFGGGQLGLGVAALVTGIGTLVGLKRFEGRLPQDRHATLNVCVEMDKFSEVEMRKILRIHGFQIGSCRVVTFPTEKKQEIQYEVHWRGLPTESLIPQLYETLIQRPAVLKAEWLAKVPHI